MNFFNTGLIFTPEVSILHTKQRRQGTGAMNFEIPLKNVFKKNWKICKELCILKEK